jgi:hypothetical protein
VNATGDRLIELVEALLRERVRFVVIGVAGLNYYSQSAGLLFTTEDRDLFLPPAPEDCLRAWRVAEAAGFELWAGDEPLGRPRDEQLAAQVVAHRGLVRAEAADVVVDFTLVMAGFEFETVWRRRRLFTVGGLALPVARLADIAASKAAAGRPKDRLFLATHEDALRQLGRRRLGHAPAHGRAGES